MASAHLLTLDEDLRVVLSKSIPDNFTSESVRVNFQPYEGKRIALPQRFTPDAALLERHRDLFSNAAARFVATVNDQMPATRSNCSLSK